MLILSRRDVEALLDLDALIAALAPAMADLSAGSASMPPRTAALVPERTATMLVDMPCYVPSTRALVSKLVSVFPANADGPLPVRQAVVVAFDPETGSPAALLDGTYLTAIRTGACSALSVQLLARQDASILAILGTGPQAWAHARTVSRVRPFQTVRIAGRDLARSERLAEDLRRS